MSMQVMLFSSAAFLLMFLLMSCGSGGVVCAEEVNSVSQLNSVELFKKGETKVSEFATAAVTSFSAHSLVDVNGLMVAFAEANSNCDGSCCSIEIRSKSLRYEEDKLPSGIIKTKDENQWMVQPVVSKMRNESYCPQLFGPSAVVKDDKIYILLSSFTTPKIPKKGGSNASLWDLELLVGTVGKPADSSTNTITWEPSKSLKDTLKQKLTDGGSSWDELRVFGRGIVMGGSTILFPMHATTSSAEEAQNDSCTVIYSEDNGINWNFPSGKIIAEDCRHATVLEWEGKLVMIPTSSEPSNNTRKVYVSADKGKTWAEDGESGSSLLVDILIRATSVDENGMMTATINGKNLTLISQPAISSGSGDIDQVHLFMTDNKRIASVGPISLDHDISSDCKLLLTKENGGLFALCDEGSQDSPESVVLFSLIQQLERIKSVLESWESTDEQVSSSCTAASKEAPCSTPPMPTRGLVGFLSNNSDSTHWIDEYFGVNATVTGGAKVENGFKLSGPGAKVEWRFGEQEQNQLYSFADLGLTLVATVTINNIPESDTSLMSVGLTSKAVGLWYDKENHWKGLSGEEEGNNYWEKGKPYRVAITVLNGTGSVYIGGKHLGGLDPIFRPNNDGQAAEPSRPGDVPHELKEEVRDICFGNCPFMHNGYGNNGESSFTVTNVFLYNRVLNDTELPPPPPPAPQQQQQQQKQQEQSQPTAEETRKTTTTGNSTVEKPTATTPQQENEQSQSTAKETGKTTTTGNSTVEKPTATTPQQEQEQSQSTAEETRERKITWNPTDEERSDTTPQHEKEQSLSTAEETRGTTITGRLTDRKRRKTKRAGKNSSVHESLSGVFQLFALLVFLGSATLL